jgi:pimeloyl-ACP methyl ester carboxylesterase
MIAWMRTGWEHASDLLPPPATGAIGHSYGALLAARLASEVPVSAYASLSGPWSEWPSVPPRPVRLILAPRLFAWGGGFGDTLAQFEGGWAGLPTIKHKAVLADAGHWDYLPAGRTSCESERGSCNVTWAVAGDVVSTFFGKYLPPESWPTLGVHIPDSLVPPTRSLTQEQEFFAGGHLTAFDLIQDRAECGVTLGWEVGSSSGTVTRP